MAKEWFYQLMGAEFGPVSSAELKHKAQLGQILADTLVRAAPDGKWQTADRIKGLIDPPPAAAAPARGPLSRSAAETDTALGIPVAAPAVAADVDERTYHVHGEGPADAPQDSAPESGEYEFFRMVGFELALGTRLHQVLVEHCGRHRVTMTEVTRRALAEFLGRKDLLEEPAAAADAAQA